MSRDDLPHVVVGNDFVAKPPKKRRIAPVMAVAGPASLPSLPVMDETSSRAWQKTTEFWHRHSLAAFILLFIIVLGSAIQVGAMYWSAHITLQANTQKNALHLPAQPLQGPNTAILASESEQTINKITTQPLNLDIAGKAVSVKPDTIKSWLQVVNDKSTDVTYIHVNQKAIDKSLNEAAAPYIKAPVNQVSVTHTDGTSMIIAAGHSGTKLGDITPLVKQIGQNLLGAKGMNLTLPTETQAFASVTPTAFDKLIEVNVVTKQMYLYDKGNITKSYPVSAGAPATPTPIGQFKIYSKLTVQDMRGFNADGSKYFQPHVHWINYFLPGGYAVHGNYWRPSSWFGAVNSSHGCVSLPDYQAKEVYDWAPLGTTVITHY